MQGAEPLRRVHADIEEAATLGLRMTPMIFINGVEFTGWGGVGALGRAIERVAATNPPVLTAAADRPPAALEKYVNDWRKQRRRQIPAGDGGWALGPAAAPVEIVVWGDYQEPFTAELDGRFRTIVASRPDARYAFRHYPMDQACNDQASRTLHPEACRAASAAEAAGRLGGNEAYWAMHAWLMENQSSFGDEAFIAAAIKIGIDPGAFLSPMDAPEVADAIRADTAAGKRLGLRGVPFIFVNGKRIVAWRLEGEPLLETIVEEAAQGR
jgi:protein-disulfide isomerase